MTRTIVDFHVLQTVPPSNLNRDDTGSPKTAVYGGKQRARVSSQAWKRAIRESFSDLLDAGRLGHRTKRVVAVLTGRITAIDAGLEPVAAELAAAALPLAGIKVKAPKAKEATEEAGYLVFLSDRQYTRLAEETVRAHRAGSKPDGKRLRAIVDADHSVDIALFGRMIADSADFNVDAACQVAHALSVHAVDNEYDYFTAVDDAKKAKEETGAGMIGTVEFNSATLYRYAAVDVDLLRDNLGGDAGATVLAVGAFARAFVRSMPTGKMKSFGNRTLPDLVSVRVRRTQPINLVGAFERAVRRTDEGLLSGAIGALAAYTERLEERFEEEPDHKWLCAVADGLPKSLGDPLTLNGLLSELERHVSDRLAG